MDSKKNAKHANKFVCELCDFNTYKTTDYYRHLETNKHIRKVNDSNITQKHTKSYKCPCGKIYKHDSSYYRHKKKCNINNDTHIIPSTIKTDIVIEMLKPTTLIPPDLAIELLNYKKEMKEMKQILLQQTNTINELVKNGNNNTINENTINDNTINEDIIYENTINEHTINEDIINDNKINDNIIINPIYNTPFHARLVMNEISKDDISLNNFVKSIHLNSLDIMTNYEIGVIEAFPKALKITVNELLGKLTQQTFL